MEEYQNAVIGFTFYGAGAALKNPAGSVILEQSTLVGREFVDCYQERPVKNINMKTKNGRTLFSRLSARGEVRDGSVYSFAAVPEVCRLFQENGGKAYFLTDILSITPEDGAFSITYFNQDGEKTIRARRILDTTAQAALRYGHVAARAKKYLNAIAEGEGLACNPITGRSVFRFPVGIWDDMITARHQFYTRIKKLPDLRVHHVSNSFSYEMPPVKIVNEPGYVISPSCGYDSLFEAFDEGGLFDEA